MKNLYQINKTLVITNIVLGFTIYLGLLFLIPLGIAQIIMGIYMIYNEKKLTKKISKLLTFYILTSTSVLISLFFIYTSFFTNGDGLFILIMIISILLAFLHLYITYLINNNLKIRNHGNCI